VAAARVLQTSAESWWSTVTVEATPAQGARTLDRVVIRFAGDSGDGMQLVGDRFTELSAAFGNDLATLPNFPAEIRAPAGTIAGVSSFQVHISDHDISTPGDTPNVLVAMNPAALKANIRDLVAGSTLLINVDAFDTRNLDKAGYASNPLRDDSLAAYRVYEVPMTSITVEATKPLGVKPRDAERSKNFFALGLICWMYTRPTEPLYEWINKRFANRPAVLEANLAAFKAGYNFGETAELFDHAYEIKPAQLPSGTYRQITGNVALSYGLVAAAQQAKLPLLYASYPITPASDILHELSKLKNFGVKTLQAEDEISAASIAIGAAFAGALGVTGTSGPGVDLKAEAMGLAVSLELPLVLVDVQRGGPSTGLPTKTEQADLLLAMYGRHGEAPLPIVAARSPADCFDAAFEAVRIAVKYCTPVILLTDGYLANAAEPWALPNLEAMADISVQFATEPNHGDEFWPYLRDPQTLARPWAIPGTPGLMHRVGGIEKEDGTGNISYDPENHDHMSRLRAAKIAGIAADIPGVELDDPDGADFLLLSWGGTWGAASAAVQRIRGRGMKIAQVHLRHLNPFPRDLGEVLRRYRQILVPELNLGQLSRLVRAEFLVDAQSYTRLAGVPFQAAELENAILEMMQS
jgi:2-oxoglutarate ferredoxin oxidoreductase subunit alpha